MPDLASTDWLVLLLYVLGSIGIGVSLRSSIKNPGDYFQAGREVGTGTCAMALIIAGLGLPELLGLGAAGASFGFSTGFYFILGSVLALLIVAHFMVPLFYGSGAATLPGYLGLRFDAKTRAFSAVMFVVMSMVSAGIALFIVARVLQALRIFDRIFFAYGWPRGGIFLVCVLLAAVPVFVCVVVAGLRGTVISQLVQFVLLVAGLLPVVFTALNNLGGMNALHDMDASLSPFIASSSRTTVGLTAMALGFVFGAARWVTDFRALQIAFAAKSAQTARRATIIASAAWIAVPFLFVLPGAIAISVPTPQSKTTIRNENGAIYHEITIVPREISEGRGIVPAVIDPGTNSARLDGSGHALLDYGMATPNLLTHFARTGLLGLGIAGLLASLMSGIASAAIATSSVFTLDLYGPLLGESVSEAKLLQAGRWASAAAVLIAIGGAFGIAHVSDAAHGSVISTWLVAAVVVFVLLQVPQLATFLLGAFSKRTGSVAAFAGLFAGLVAALVHQGLTLPGTAARGVQGGWFGVIHRYDGITSQMFFSLIFSVVANLGVAWIAGFFASAPAEADIRSLVYTSGTAKELRKSSSKRAR